MQDFPLYVIKGFLVMQNIALTRFGIFFKKQNWRWLGGWRVRPEVTERIVNQNVTMVNGWLLKQVMVLVPEWKKEMWLIT